MFKTGDGSYGVLFQQMTALHWAAFHKRPDHVQELVEKGTNILATDVDGKLALHWAAQVSNHFISILRLCLHPSNTV